jgi:hypothetical protein
VYEAGAFPVLLRLLLEGVLRLRLLGPPLESESNVAFERNDSGVRK